MTAAFEKSPPITLQQVRAWFQEAWPEESSYPNQEYLYSIAVGLNVVRSLGSRAPKRASPLGPCEDAAKKFLKHVANARAEIARRNNGKTDETMQAASGIPLPPLLSASRKLDAAERALVDLLAACKPIPWRDPAIFIMQYVCEAWASVPNAEPQLGRYSDSALVHFLKLSLDAVPLALSPETISDRLRERSGGGASASRTRARAAERQGAKLGEKHP
jgi:hypothetical protein